MICIVTPCILPFDEHFAKKTISRISFCTSAVAEVPMTYAAAKTTGRRTSRVMDEPCDGRAEGKEDHITVSVQDPPSNAARTTQLRLEHQKRSIRQGDVLPGHQ